MVVMNEIDRSFPALDSDLLRTFVAVARHGNVTRAAASLHRTQSAVSVQIRRLEELLGTALFVREPRGVSLTGSGESLHSAAIGIIDMLDRTARGFAREPLRGQVRIGIPDDYGASVLPRILAGFNARHPAVEVEVRCGFSPGFPAAVERGELDLAVFASDRAVPDGSLLAEEETVWVASRQLRPADDDPVRLALFDRACWWRDAAMAALRSAGRPFRIVCSSESVAGVKAAVQAGLAVGVLARSTVEPAMRILGDRDGFPPLPRSHLVLLEAGCVESPAVEAMAAIIRSDFQAGLAA